MKRIIALLLALMMCLTLCACGEGGNGGEPSSYNFGDSITTESGMFVFTPAFDGFARALNNWGNENYLLPQGKTKDLEASDNPYFAEEGKTMMYFSATVEYVGDSKENESFDFSFKVDYDGYVFDSTNSDTISAKGYSLDQMSWDIGSSATAEFEPLSSDTTRYIRFCIEVPEQVENDTEKQTSVIFTIGEKEYTFIADTKAAAEAKAAREAAAEAERAEKMAEVSEELASEIKSKLQGEWTFTTYGTIGTSVDATTHYLTFSGDSITVQTKNSVISGYLSSTGTYYVGNGYIVMNFDDGAQALIPYEYTNGELSLSSEFEGSFHSL